MGKKRHKITFFLLVPWLRLFCYLRYNYRGIKCKEKGTICIFPKGNRTYNGKLCYAAPSIVKL